MRSHKKAIKDRNKQILSKDSGHLRSEFSVSHVLSCWVAEVAVWESYVSASCPPAKEVGRHTDRQNSLQKRVNTVVVYTDDSHTW